MNDRHPRAIVVGPDAAALRRALGPTAWTVLEATLAVADGSDGALLADVSVRQLASVLGLAHGTIARALLVLRRDGILTPTQARAVNGAVARGRYVVAVPSNALTLAAPRHTSAPARPTRRVTSCPSVEQLALLPE